VQSLVENPRTPVGISMGLLNLLRDHNLKQLQRNREVPHAVRTAAGRKLARKTGGVGGAGGGGGH
jgi:hypothetical protein